MQMCTCLPCLVQGLAPSAERTWKCHLLPLPWHEQASPWSLRTCRITACRAPASFLSLRHYIPATLTFLHLFKSPFPPGGFNGLNFLQSSLCHPAPLLPNLSTSYSAFQPQVKCHVFKEAFPDPSCERGPSLLQSQVVPLSGILSNCFSIITSVISQVSLAFLVHHCFLCS